MPLVQNPSLGSSQIAMLTATTIVTAAQLASIKTTPIAVVPAPGSGKIIQPLIFAAVYRFGTRAFLPADSTGPVFFYANNPADIIGFTFGGMVTAAQDQFVSSSASAPASIPILPGSDNQAVMITSDVDYDAGPIVTATLGAGGLGYVANDTGTITNGANDATYKVLTVGAGGAVLTFQITGAGTECTVANGNATVDAGAQPGVGVGFTVNITAVQTGDGTLKVVTYYQIIPVP